MSKDKYVDLESFAAGRRVDDLAHGKGDPNGWDTPRGQTTPTSGTPLPQGVEGHSAGDPGRGGRA